MTILIPVRHAPDSRFSRLQGVATKEYMRLFNGGASYGLAFTEYQYGLKNLSDIFKLGRNAQRVACVSYFAFTCPTA